MARKKIESTKEPKNITISTRVALQNSGVVFEINESHSFKETDYTLEEIDEMKTQLLANNLISINNFQKKMEG
jgi:hypothetical protein